MTRELPNNVPYAAKVSLILDFQLTREQSMFKCFDAVQKSVDEFLTRHIDQQFQRYENLKAIVRCVFASSHHLSTPQARVRFAPGDSQGQR